MEPKAGELNEKSRINVLWSVSTSRTPPSSVPSALTEVNYEELDPLHLYRLLLSCSKMKINIPWKQAGPALTTSIRHPECKTMYLPRLFTSTVETAPLEVTEDVLRILLWRLDEFEYRDLEEIYQALAQFYRDAEMLFLVEKKMMIFQKRGAAPDPDKRVKRSP